MSKIKIIRGLLAILLLICFLIGLTYLVRPEITKTSDPTMTLESTTLPQNASDALVCITGTRDEEGFYAVICRGKAPNLYIKPAENSMRTKNAVPPYIEEYNPLIDRRYNNNVEYMLFEPAGNTMVITMEDPFQVIIFRQKNFAIVNNLKITIQRK